MKKASENGFGKPKLARKSVFGVFICGEHDAAIRFLKFLIKN
jgi:hypothetical protein